jgi:hypothetical protein
MARYGQVFKDKAVVRLLPPENAAIDAVAQELGVCVETLARLEAVLTTVSMDEAARSAWCRKNGVNAQQLADWREAATQALADPEDARATPQQTRADKRRIKKLERAIDLDAVSKRVESWIAHARHAETWQLRHAIFHGGLFDPAREPDRLQ